MWYRKGLSSDKGHFSISFLGIPLSTLPARPNHHVVVKPRVVKQGDAGGVAEVHREAERKDSHAKSCAGSHLTPNSIWKLVWGQFWMCHSFVDFTWFVEFSYHYFQSSLNWSLILWEEAWQGKEPSRSLAAKIDNTWLSLRAFTDDWPDLSHKKHTERAVALNVILLLLFYS